MNNKNKFYIFSFHKYFEQERALKTAAVTSFLLLLLKLLAFIPTGSMLVLASLLDSLADTFNSLINHFLYKASRKDADREHPFGHGGFEVLGSLGQGIVIIIFGFALLQESAHKLHHNQIDTALLDNLPLAGGILIFSALAGLGIHKFLGYHIKKLEDNNERSLLLLADQSHYKGDAVINILAAAGVLTIYFTKQSTWDAYLGCLGAAFLIYTGIPLLKKSIKDIIHSEAPPELQQLIVDIVLGLDENILGVHHLRSRELGPNLFVDFHMSVPSSLNIREAHDLSEKATAAIKKKIPRADISIHLDPESEPDEQKWIPNYRQNLVKKKDS